MMRRTILIGAAFIGLTAIVHGSAPRSVRSAARANESVLPIARDVSASILEARRAVTLPAGTVLRLQLTNSVGSDISRVESPVHARLVNAISRNGQVVLPAGSAVSGSVTSARRSGKVKGRAHLGMRFYSITPAGDDQSYRMSTSNWARTAPGTKKKDAAKIGIPAAGGAIVGGLIGGKKGAGVGAAAGGGAGTAVVLTTRGKEVRAPSGSIVTVRLTTPLTVHIG